MALRNRDRRPVFTTPALRIRELVHFRNRNVQWGRTTASHTIDPGRFYRPLTASVIKTTAVSRTRTAPCHDVILWGLDRSFSAYGRATPLFPQTSRERPTASRN